MKLPFKYITILIIISLAAIFSYQVYWLVGMYNTEKTQAMTTIRQEIRNADHTELFMRVDSVSTAKEERAGMNAGEPEESSISFSLSIKGGETADTIVTDIDKTIVKDTTKTVSKEREEKALDNEKWLGDGLESIEMVFAKFQKGMHQAIDEVIGGPDINKFDSILTANLLKANLDVLHYTQIIYLQNDSVLQSSFSEDTDTLKLLRFEYIYDMNDEYAYRVYVEPVHALILKQLIGILGSSFIILVILGFSFWYLVRTIRQQKDLDEMKSDFTNNITHELKTPIAVAYAANDALLNFNQVEDKSKREKYLAISQEQLRKLSGLVEQILSMSMENRKGFRINMENVHVNPLIISLIEQHKLKADKNVHIEVEIEDDIYIETDRVHFSNIISNLIYNAIKYSKEEAVVTIGCQRKANRIEIAVSDRGVGISAEKQKHIFDKFYRVPTGKLHDVKGYGLGLFYVRTTTDKLWGTISVKS